MELKGKKLIKDKVVFVFENGSQFDQTLFESNYFQSVSKVIDTFLRINSVDSNRIFFGGDVLDLKLFLTGVLNFCYMADNLNVSQSFEYEEDEDFEYDPHTDLAE